MFREEILQKKEVTMIIAFSWGIHTTNPSPFMCYIIRSLHFLHFSSLVTVCYFISSDSPHFLKSRGVRSRVNNGHRNDSLSNTTGNKLHVVVVVFVPRCRILCHLFFSILKWNSPSSKVQISPSQFLGSVSAPFHPLKRKSKYRERDTRHQFVNHTTTGRLVSLFASYCDACFCWRRMDLWERRWSQLIYILGIEFSSPIRPKFAVIGNLVQFSSISNLKPRMTLFRTSPSFVSLLCKCYWNESDSDW